LTGKIAARPSGGQAKDHLRSLDWPVVLVTNLHNGRFMQVSINSIDGAFPFEHEDL